MGIQAGGGGTRVSDAPPGKLHKLLALLACTRWRRALRHGVAAAVEHRKPLRPLDPATVIDIGANRGQFSLLIRTLFPHARVLAVEPQAEAAETFRALFDGDDYVRLIPLAIAPESGDMTLHLSRRRDSSSLLPIGPLQERIFPGTAENGTAAVRTARLAEVLAARDILRPALLKLDVQGFELAALQGCSELLQYIDWVYCECSFVELYEGQALLPEVADYLAGHGFVERGRFNLTEDRHLGPIQADVLFGRLKSNVFGFQVSSNASTKR